MSDVAAIGTGFHAPGERPANASRAEPTIQRSALTDRVELSSAAGAAPEFSPEVERYIASIRDRIADGTYLTPDKVDAVVERLFDELCRART